MVAEDAVAAVVVDPVGEIVEAPLRGAIATPVQPVALQTGEPVIGAQVVPPKHKAMWSMIGAQIPLLQLQQSLQPPLLMTIGALLHNKIAQLLPQKSIGERCWVALAAAPLSLRSKRLKKKRTTTAGTEAITCGQNHRLIIMKVIY